MEQTSLFNIKKKYITSNKSFKGFGDAKKDGSVNKSNDWWTPREVFINLDIEFDLDVASPIGGVNYIPAKNYYTKADNGLIQDWYGTVWCNPPYGRDLNLWMEKFINHGQGIALIFARTDTLVFHNLVLKADALTFKRKRIAFYNPNFKKNTSGTGSLFVAMGNDCVDAIKKIDGWHINLRDENNNG
tara:strand:- start:82 stop:642 length:561 start_codon:yes stop_codon:yes gene_type:complete